MSGVLDGRRALVTGAGSGIGRGIACGLSTAGARVAISGRRAGPLEETAALIQANSGTCHVQTFDVGDAAATAVGVEAVAQALDGLDIVVNNAGIGGPNACSQAGEDRWHEIVRANLDGPFFVSRAALTHMGGGGRIINISSVLGRFGVPGYTAYCASKHGVIGFTKALALEVADRGITVNAICPGWVDTEMARAGMQMLAEAMDVSFEEARKGALDLVPIKRIITPAEIAELVVYMAGEGASAMTGQAVSLCGGATMW